jgi:hypothetical protein
MSIFSSNTQTGVTPISNQEKGGEDTNSPEDYTKAQEPDFGEDL